MSDFLKLPVHALTPNLAENDFSQFEELELPSNILGQARAQSALEFGVAMPHSGYNIFVMGEAGSGRLSMIMNHLQTLAHQMPAPASYAYVDNFENAREPIAIQIPTEYGQMFYQAIEKFIDDLLMAFPAAFESPTYQQKKTAIEREFHQIYNAALDAVDKKARSYHIALFRESESITFAPFVDGKTLDESQFAQLTEKKREKFHRDLVDLQDYLSETLIELPQWRRENVEKTKRLDNDTIAAVVEPLFQKLHEQFAEIEDVVVYLIEIQKNINNSIIDYLSPNRAIDLSENALKRLLLEEYAPHILIDNKQDSGAPIIYEAHPTYQNLFGRVEYSNDQGALITNYHRICAGSLHKANGGYLILDAEKLLTYPFVWDGLKRALQAGYIEIDSPYTELGINTVTLKPEVIPLKIKVIIVGSSEIYYLLEEMDSEFSELFKILADFDERIPRTFENTKHFAHLMYKQVFDLQGISLTSESINALILHSCRLAENQHYFSARINESLEVLNEAQFFCKKENAQKMTCDHVNQALDAREFRNGRIAQTILEEMLNGTILIDTQGKAVGKINGLTVMEIGGSSFGTPSRITTTVYPGSRGIVDIEREVELGQALHSKGVMILTGYLGHKYAQQFPLAISASIAIEQSYGYIDGDSASLAELCSLISALIHVPIKQSFAVTGSINQYGEVQAIGGVNEKIEGFFNLCLKRGLDGSHAVIIPAANCRNLVLKSAILKAVEAELFSIYAVNFVDEALELLMCQTAGKPDLEGIFPENCLNEKVILRLKEISEIASHEEEKENET